MKTWADFFQLFWGSLIWKNLLKHIVFALVLQNSPPTGNWSWKWLFDSMWAPLYSSFLVQTIWFRFLAYLLPQFDIFMYSFPLLILIWFIFMMLGKEPLILEIVITLYLDMESSKCFVLLFFELIQYRAIINIFKREYGSPSK